MVSTKERVFLVTGSDFTGRRLIVENIKKKVLQKNITSLNILTFYPKETNIKDLQEKISLASFDQEKILIFKDAYNLLKEVKDLLFNNFNKIISNNYIILEVEKDHFSSEKKAGTDRFFGLILSRAACYKTTPGSQKASFYDFKKSIRSNDLVSALYVLAKLFEDKSSDNEKKALSLQLFGILVAESSYLKNDALRKKYFNCLWKTDRSIKEKGLDPRLAIELFLANNLGM